VSLDNAKAFNPKRAKKKTKVNAQNRKVYDLNHQIVSNATSPAQDQDPQDKLRQPLNITGGFSLSSNL
jgi:hypothetical protein